MINQPVIVTANKEGHIINETSNPDWYRFRVEQAFPTMSGGYSFNEEAFSINFYQ